MMFKLPSKNLPNSRESKHNIFTIALSDDFKFYIIKHSKISRGGGTGGLGGGQAAPPPLFARAIGKMIGFLIRKYEFHDACTQLPHQFFTSCSAPDLWKMEL